MNSKHGIMNDAMAPADGQGHLASRSSGSHIQLYECLLKVGKSHSTPWLRTWNCDWRESYLTWVMRVASCLRCWCWSRGRVLGERVSKTLKAVQVVRYSEPHHCFEFCTVCHGYLEEVSDADTPSVADVLDPLTKLAVVWYGLQRR